MLTEDYVSYEVAKLLKEKGFPMDEHLYMYVNKDGKLMTDHQACLTMTDEEYRTFFDNYIPTVTQALAMKWLREVHELFVDISFVKDEHQEEKLFWFYAIFELSNNNAAHYNNVDEFTTYEEAVEAALKYCLTELI